MRYVRITSRRLFPIFRDTARDEIYERAVARVDEKRKRLAVTGVRRNKRIPVYTTRYIGS